MRNAKRVCASAALAMAMLLSGCVALAPGAERVKVTDRPADVKGCSAVGNIRVRRHDYPLDVENSLRNQAVGLGGNVVYRTSPWTGVAYRCE